MALYMACINCLTIDLEPWMCIYDNTKLIKELDDNLTLQTTYQLLNILDKYDTTATFFVLGKIYEWYPGLVKEIAQAGHEIAFHTYTHRIIRNNKALEEEIFMSSNFLNTFKPKGFRAPQMILPRSTLSILSKYGFKYSSSTYAPIGRPIVYKEKIMEVPVSTYPLLKKKVNICFPRHLIYALKNFEIPFGSGLFVGLLSSRLLNNIIRSYNKEGKSVVLLIHPWQLITKKVKLSLKHITKLPYIASKITPEKLRNLLEKNYFTTISDLLKEFYT